LGGYICLSCIGDYLQENAKFMYVLENREDTADLIRSFDKSITQVPLDAKGISSNNQTGKISL
jgi:hypothetical protein